MNDLLMPSTINKTKGTLVLERGMENKNFNDVFLAIL